MSFNNVLWNIAPKTDFVGLETLEISAYIACIMFSIGWKGLLFLMSNLDIEPGKNALSAAVIKDQLRIKEAEKQTEMNSKEARRLRRQLNIPTADNEYGSLDTNGRGDALLQYLVTTSLYIMNRGREPTFCNSVRSEVIDLTLCTVGMEGWVGSWRVSNEPSLSDHRYIQFEWKERCSETRAFRNPRKTDWAFFRENLRNKLQSFKPSFGTTDELDHWAFELGEIVNISFQRSCPWTIPKGTWGTPWWNWELEDLRRETGRTFNRDKNTRNIVDWRILREAQRLYKNRINVVWLEAIRLPTGEYTTSEEECLKLLLEANFPGFRLSHEMENESSGRNRQPRAAWDLAAKAPGIDGIYSAFLQEGLEGLVGPLVKLFRASVALAHVPEIWKTAKVVFIPKLGKSSHATVKDYRPISLNSFVFKTLKRLVDRFIQDDILTVLPLHPNQHAYRTRFSTETALHSAVWRIEE
ncbi:uncharacterized protein LOC116415865 [Nasonia vitripennis]|uniref:Endonuclease/exonuclease/phosphatase domain-containing protein n=1 Tax=Nasonia vitripennis TaxID=7425 RepID=A0A7M7PUM2_NASVI|nr:uncharacterized protein LOC116415865 [Nasonia vitripennis]